MNLNLSSPAWLALLPLAIVLMVLLHRQRRSSQLNYAFDGSQRTIAAHNLVACTLLLLSRICLLLGVFTLIFALAGPTRLSYHTPATPYQPQMIFALDLSPSMAVIDNVGQSRLDIARLEINNFLRLKPDMAIGLVGFGSDAALLASPSPDHRTLVERLTQLQAAMLGEGTAIGAGLAVAANHLRDRPRERSIVLISDGSNNSGALQPEIAFRLLRQQGIQLYIIALQNASEEEVLLRNPETGQIYQARLDNQQGWDELRTLLERENIGQFFQAGSAEELAAAMRNIESNEEQSIAPAKELIQIPIHSHVIVIALVLIFLGWLLPKMLLWEIL